MIIIRNSKLFCIAILLLTISPFLFFLPADVRARRRYENITASSDFGNGFTIDANLTYETEEWLFDYSKTLWFAVSVTIPPAGNMSLNITRMNVFIDFNDDGFIYSLHQNDTVKMFQSHESQILLNETYSVTVYSDQLGFIKDGWDAGYLGFRMEYNVSMAVDAWTLERSKISIFSHYPDEDDWPSYGLTIGDNNDYVHLDDFLEILSPTPLLLLLLLGGGSVIISLVVGAKGYSYWSEHNPKSYIDGKKKIGGKKYNLGGLQIALAYCLKIDVPDTEEAILAKSLISEWAKKEFSIDINAELDDSQLPEVKRILWKRAEDRTSINAAGIFTYLLNTAPIGERGVAYVKLLEDNGFSLGEKTRRYLLDNTDKTAENLRTRWMEERNPNKKILARIDEMFQTITSIDERIPDVDGSTTEQELASILIASRQIENRTDERLESIREHLGFSQTDLLALISDKTTSYDGLLEQIHEIQTKTALDEDIERFYVVDPIVLEEKYSAIENASTNEEKGNALEDFCEYIFNSLRGFRVQKNERAATGEIDLFIENGHGSSPFFKSLGKRILVECKNWGKKIGVPVVDQIIADMMKYDSHFTILITRKGITGNQFKDAKRLTLKMHDKEGLDIIVFDDSDIHNLVDGQNLVVLLRKKREELRLS